MTFRTNRRTRTKFPVHIPGIKTQLTREFHNPEEETRWFGSREYGQRHWYRIEPYNDQVEVRFYSDDLKERTKSNIDTVAGNASDIRMKPEQVQKVLNDSFGEEWGKIFYKAAL